jgi:hypothetical protein
VEGTGEGAGGRQGASGISCLINGAGGGGCDFDGGRSVALMTRAAGRVDSVSDGARPFFRRAAAAFNLPLRKGLKQRGDSAVRPEEACRQVCFATDGDTLKALSISLDA